MDRMPMDGIVPGDVVEGVAVLVERKDATTKGGQAYLVVRLRNGTGSRVAKVWSEHVPAWDGIDVGRGVRAVAEVIPGWKGAPPELNLLRVEALPQGHPVELEINPVCPDSRESLEERFAAAAARIARPGVRKLLEVVLEHVGWDAYATAPAAVGHHHAYIHGLLEHSVEVCETAIEIAARRRFRDHIDLDIVIAGSLLHDLGKVNTYEWRCPRTGAPKPIAVSRLGRLVDHVVTGPMLVQAATTTDDKWRTLRDAGCRCIDVQAIVHIQVSHHLTREWGSPTEPCTPEALIVHHADNTSAKVRGLLDVVTTQECSADGWIEHPGWPYRHPVLYLGALAPTTPDAAGIDQAMSPPAIRDAELDGEIQGLGASATMEAL